MMPSPKGGGFHLKGGRMNESDVHTVADIPMAVNPAVQAVILRRFKEVRRLYSRGVKIVFTDIERLEKLMSEELAMDILHDITK